jgi:hypothetical protein
VMQVGINNGDDKQVIVVTTFTNTSTNTNTLEAPTNSSN